jgi:2-polyprenyl-6-methoxyphenol hydroxylase-like FAD-dependent oxidoreductase
MGYSLLPLPNGAFSIIWTVNSDDYTYLINLSEEAFTDEVNYAFQSHNQQ